MSGQDETPAPPIWADLADEQLEAETLAYLRSRLFDATGTVVWSAWQPICYPDQTAISAFIEDICASDGLAAVEVDGYLDDLFDLFAYTILRLEIGADDEPYFCSMYRVQLAEVTFGIAVSFVLPWVTAAFATYTDGAWTKPHNDRERDVMETVQFLAHEHGLRFIPVDDPILQVTLPLRDGSGSVRMVVFG